MLDEAARETFKTNIWPFWLACKRGAHTDKALEEFTDVESRVPLQLRGKWSISVLRESQAKTIGRLTRTLGVSGKKRWPLD